MTENVVKRKLAKGGNALGSMVFEFFAPGIARICANAGPEFVVNAAALAHPRAKARLEEYSGNA